MHRPKYRLLPLAKKCAAVMFNIAKSNDVLEEIDNVIVDIGKILSNRDVISFFNTAKIVGRGMLEGFCKEHAPKANILSNAIMYMYDCNAISAIDMFFIEYDKIRNNAEYINLFTYSDCGLDIVSKITKELQNMTDKKIIINSCVDKNLLGGFKIVGEHFSYDKSLKYIIDDITSKVLGEI